MTELALIASDPADDSRTGSTPHCSDDLNGATDAPETANSQGISSADKVAWRNPEIRIFVSTFFTIFLAELGDKTQLTTLLMVAGTRSPWVIFLGAGAALVLTTLIGVLLGRWVATKISPRTLETSAGAMLLLISVLLLWDVVNL